MSSNIKTKKSNGLEPLNNTILGFKRDNTTGQVNILTKSNPTTGSRISFIGYNDLYSNWYAKYQSSDDTFNSYSNPAFLTQKLLGYGNHNDSRYANPVRANCRRVYLPSTIVQTNNSSKASYAPASIQMRDRKDFLFYIDTLWDLNMSFTDVTKTTISVVWRSDILSGNNPNDVFRLNGYQPKLVCENVSGAGFSKSGRAYGIECSNNVFPELPSTNLAGITITVNSNGSGMTVGGVPQTSYIIPVSKLKVAKFAAQSYSLINRGAGKRYTGTNKGAFGIESKVASYEYIQFVDGTFANDISAPSKFVGPQMACRIAKDDLRCLDTNNADFYTDTPETWLNNEYSYIADIHCFVPAQNCPKDCSTIQNLVYSQGFFNTWSKGDYSGTPYYDPQGEIDPNGGSTTSLVKAKVIQTDNYDMIMSIKEAYDYGVFTFVDAFWSFQNYNYSIYSQSGADEIRKTRLKAESEYMQQITKTVKLIIDQVGFCQLILGNESNLEQNLKGTFYGTYPGVATNSYIFFADIDNQSKQANVNAMMDFFNRVAGMLKMIYGDKIMVGPSVQIGGISQANEILTAVSLGLASNFDCLFNNFYCNGSPTDPYLAFDGFDVLSYYKQQLDTNPTWRKLNIIMSECGIPRKVIDINDIPTTYTRNITGLQGYTVGYPNPIVYTDMDLIQGSIAYNLIDKGLRTTRNQYIQGIILFGDADQVSRLSLESGYGVSVYNSFYVPSKNFATLADSKSYVDAYIANNNVTIPQNKLSIWAEEYMSHLWKDTPRNYDTANPSIHQSTEFLDSFATLATKETNAMVQVRNIITSGVPDLKYINQI